MADGLIRVREFAEMMGCTPQNIYLHLKNYAKELEGHVIDSRQGKLLDEFACDFLRKVMYPRELDANSETARLNQELNEMRGAFMRVGQENLRIAAELLDTKGNLERSELENQQFRKALKAAEEADAAKDAQLEAAHQETAEAVQGRQKAEEDNQELRRLLEQERAEKEAALARETALKQRNWWGRLTRKGE